MKVNCILLAAGNSTRYDGNKLLAQVDGKPMYRQLLDKVLLLSEELCDKINRIILVTQYSEIIEETSSLPITVIKNNYSENGIAYSIELGVEAVRNDSPNTDDAYMFFVCDQPYLSVDTIKGLIEGYFQSSKGLGCVAFGKRLGNPAIFSSAYREDLLNLYGDTGGKRIIVDHMDDTFLYYAKEEKELMDIDTKAEREDDIEIRQIGVMRQND